MLMKMKRIVFNGFRHVHIDGLYKAVCSCPGIQTVGCYEPDKMARESAATRLGAEISSGGFEQMLNVADIVAIGGRYGERGEAVIQALKAGKHVIADKPICTSLYQLSEIKRLSEEKQLSVMCMLDLRYTPNAVVAKKLLESGELGEIRNVSFNGQHCLDYGKRPEWYFEEGMHGGTVNDLAIHGVDLVRMLTGMDFIHADAVRTWNSYAVKTPDFKDCAMLMARLENGAGVMADISYSAPKSAFTLPSYWEFRFWCADGMLEFNYATPGVRVYREGESKGVTVFGEKPTGSWLSDLLSEIDGEYGCFTREVLESARQTLWLQAQAEKC